MSAPHVRLAAILGLLAFTLGASPASGTAAPGAAGSGNARSGAEASGATASRDAEAGGSRRSGHSHRSDRPGGSGRSTTGGRALIGPPAGDDLHVMSTNIRMDFDTKGPPDAWRVRLPILIELIERERPTLIGAQEVLYSQLKQLRRRLPEAYDSIGIGSEGGSRGQFMQIFFDGTRLEPIEFDHFWLSGKPSEIGSTTWGNDEFMRMATWVRFLDRRTDQEFYHLNTHFDHRSESARKRSAELVKKRIKGFKDGLPVVVTGDFNARAEDSDPYEILTTGKGALKDAWKRAKKQVTPAYGTFPNYGPLKVGTRRIDWILFRGMTVRSIGHNGFRVKGNYPSDHLPVQAVVKLKA